MKKLSLILLMFFVAFSAMSQDESSLELGYSSIMTVGEESLIQVYVDNDLLVYGPAVEWQVEDETIATINENGVLKALALGTTSFTATYNGLSVIGKVNVSDSPDIPSTADLYKPDGGLVIAVYIPEGSDCNGIAVKSCNLTGNPEVKMEKVKGRSRWYQVRIPGAGEQGTDSYGATYEGVDFAAGNSYQCKVCALPESGLVDGNWTTQWNVNGLEIMNGSAPSAEWQDDYGTLNKLSVSESGYVFVNIANWNSNPCATDREYTFTVVVPECTPEGQETVNVIGSFPDADGNTWSKGTDFPIVDGKATITITGQDATEWKVRLTSGEWSDQAIHCDTNDKTGEIRISMDANRTLGDSEGQEIYIEGWGDYGTPLDGCLSDCIEQFPKLLTLNRSYIDHEFEDGAEKTYTLEAKLGNEYDGFENVTALANWSSSDESVAIVDKGLVTIVGSGRCNIECEYNNQKAECSVYVSATYNVTIGIPECTPADATIYICGKEASIDWETMTATVSVFGYYGDNNVGIKMYSEYYWGYYNPVRCKHVDENREKYNYQDRSYYDNITLAEAAAGVIQVEGWSGVNGCLSDCVALYIDIWDNNMYSDSEPMSLLAYLGDNDVTSLANWSSSDENVALVANGVVTPVAPGEVEISCEYAGQRRVREITVYSRDYISRELLSGSDYYIFQMDDLTFAELQAQGKITADMCANGECNVDGTLPDGVTRAMQILSPSSIVDRPECSGLNSFGKNEEWFTIQTVDGASYYMTGGYVIRGEDPELHKLQNLTSDHVFAMVMKYDRWFEGGFYMSDPESKGALKRLSYEYGPSGIDENGEWELFTISCADLAEKYGFDFSTPITSDFWLPFYFDSRLQSLEVDCIMFYLPENKTDIDETDSAEDNIVVTARNGRIYCDEEFKIINLAGQDVTSLNGNLQGTYLVVAGNNAVKILVK